MPVVTESSVPAPHSIPTFWVGGTVGPVVHGTVGRQRTQTGYRSGPLSHLEKRSIDSAERSALDGGSWGTSHMDIGILDKAEYDRQTGPRLMLVNGRNYTENTSSMTSVTTAFGWSTRLGTSLPWVSNPTITGNGALLLSNIATTPNIEKPSDAEVESIASSLMRKSVPEAPGFNLFRSVAELRDAPQLARAANYIPNRVSDIGSGYLNVVFGMQPTYSDIQSAAESVLDATGSVRDLIDHGRRTSRRSSSRILDQGDYRDTVLIGGSSTGSVKSLVTTAPFARLTGSYCFPGMHGQSVEIESHLTLLQQVRQFATWEYFVPRPSGLKGRLGYYERLARNLLGSGLTSDVAWDLTPYSWLVDWYVDIGGLLRYQEASTAVQAIASRSGFVFERKLTGWVRSQGRSGQEYNSGRSRVDSAVASGAISILDIQQSRHTGGPFSVVQPWDLTQSQSLVLAALGLSKAR